MANLTIDEARTRSELLTVDGYEVALDLDTGPETFESRTTIRFEASAGAETFVDINAARIHEVSLDGAPVDPSSRSDGRVPLHVTAGHHELTAHATMAYSVDGEGLHRAVDPIDGEAHLHGMSFLDAAPRIFCCFDQPDLKAPYTLSVRAPAGWTVVGNAPLAEVDAGSWRFEPSKPLSTYLMTLVAGPYHVRTGEHDGIRMGLLARASLAPHLDKDAEELFTVTAQCFDAYHALFGIRYPFGDYYQCFVPEFNAGAMENPGCVTFRDDMIFRSRATDAERSGRARVIAHEMAHQWFGDLVTMQWWDDLWLNESFAEYMAHRVCEDATAFDDSWVDFAAVRKPWGVRADLRPSTHPVAGNGAVDGASALADFDGISYAKGASVLKQLAAHLGDDVFLGGVRDHLTRHAYANATLDDLFDAWRRAGATDLDAWTDAWLRTSGADIIGTDRAVVAPRHASTRPHTFTVGFVGPDGGRTTRSVTTTGHAVALADVPDDALVLPDVHDDTWARFRHDPTTLAMLPGRWSTITDPVARAATWLALRDSAEGADLSPEYIVDCLSAAVPHESADSTLLATARWAENVILGQFTAEPSHARTRLREAYARRLDSCPPGSALQLAAARALIAISDDTDTLTSWLDGDAPQGLVVDDELRWRIVTQLARWGALSSADIDADLDRDPSSSGHIHAIRARAALPDPDQKAAAWRRITTEGRDSNYEIFAAAEGFWWPEQSAMLDPYVRRYFDDLPATADFRSGWIAGQSAKLAFPAYVVDERTAGLAQQTLERGDLTPGVRRSITDAATDLGDALRVRETYGEHR